MNNEQYFNNLKGETRDKAVVKYRELLLAEECGEKANWSEINTKIIERWSHSALGYIKFHAFCPKTSNRRIWVTAKNTNLEYAIFLVSIADFWHLIRVGFGSYADANEHLKNLCKARLTGLV